MRDANTALQKDKETNPIVSDSQDIPTVQQASSKQKGRLAVNLITNIANYGTNIVIGFFLVPYLINHLGVSAFGLVPLATQVVSYLSVITMIINVAVGRYLTIALEQRDLKQANLIFNTSLSGALILVLLCIPPIIYILLNLDKLIRVPPEVGSSAILLMAFTITGFVINQVMTPFAISTFCRNRFDLRNAVEVSANLIRVGIVILAFNIMVPSVWHIGLGVAIASLAAGIGSVILWKTLTPELKIIATAFDKSIFKKLASMGGWLSVNHIGSLLYVGIDLIVVNRMLGPSAGGQYAVALQWSTFLRGAAAVITTVFYPTIIYYYAQNDFRGLIKYAQRSLRITGLLLALPIGLISGMSFHILQVWVKGEFAVEQYQYLAMLMTLLVIHLSINLGVYPLFHVQAATNRVKIPAIVTCVMGLCNLGLAIYLVGWAKWGMFGVAIAGAIMLTAKNLIFTPIYGAYILRAKWLTFYKETLPVIASTLIITSISWLVCKYFQPDDWVSLIIISSIISIFYFSAVILLAFTKDDRKIITGYLSSSLKRH